MTKAVRLTIDPTKLKEGKNVTGILGEKCNNCGGFGYTLSLKGGNLDCQVCEKTGVKLPTIRELQTEISAMKQDLHNLRQAIIKELGIKTNE